MNSTSERKRRFENLEETQPKISALAPSNLRRLHRRIISDPAEVRGLLRSAMKKRATLFSGVDRKSVARTATISRVDNDRLRLTTTNLKSDRRPQIYFRFEHSGRSFFFASPPIAAINGTRIDVKIPDAVYEVERRELYRVRETQDGQRISVELRATDSPGGESWAGSIVDSSRHGMRVVVSGSGQLNEGQRLSIRLLGEASDRSTLFGVVRHVSMDSRTGHDVIGLETSSQPPAPPFPVDRRRNILQGGSVHRVWNRLRIGTQLLRTKSSESLRPSQANDYSEPEVVSFRNFSGKTIRGLIDRAHGGVGGTAVVIPPAWGRTKETFLALARSIVATFEAIGEPAIVLRFDGTNRRGESYIDPECNRPGEEYLHFTFSQAIEDIQSSIKFLHAEAGVSPQRTILTTFSLGSVEGRRAVALDRGQRIDGWVSVVGMVDLQSGLRSVSGGIDYIYGLSRGVAFGRHELVGVLADMDRAGADGFSQRLMYLEDVKEDMASISVPITWVHGRDDAWMDIERVQSALASGRLDNRKLIEVPTGHQMRNSLEALETFQFVASEIARIALGRPVKPTPPAVSDIAERSRAEKRRLPEPPLDPFEFWSDYLLGRDRSIGFELMSGTSAYADLMSNQIAQLRPRGGDTIIDLGAGNGDFPLFLATENCGAQTRVIEVDLVADALKRGAARLSSIATQTAGFRVHRLSANLDLADESIPLRDGIADAVLASLFLSYVREPIRLLESAFRLLRPGGRLVVSSMKRDADVSRIYVDSIAELPPDRRESVFGLDSNAFEEVQRVFLNDAAKLLHLEEVGRFSFWDSEELIEMCKIAGFRIDGSMHAFGDPPQAVVVSASRPG